MDIYEYFNSRDVAAHCKKLDYAFTVKEMAYLIWQSNHHSLLQKIDAWQWIIDHLPDDKTLELEFAEGPGLHQFLRQYIKTLREYLDEFRSDTKDAVYSYEVLAACAPERFSKESLSYKNYHACISAILAETAKQEGVMLIRVTRKMLRDENSDEEEISGLYLSPKAEPMDLEYLPFQEKWFILDIPFGFYDITVDIPVPFKKGDIVTGIDLWGQRDCPSVLDVLKGDERLGFYDYSEMCSQVLKLDHYGSVYRNEDYNYLSLEYYRGELTEKNRFLFALHNYFQGRLCIEDFLRSYSIVFLNAVAAREMNICGWSEGMRPLAGLEQDVIRIE